MKKLLLALIILILAALGFFAFNSYIYNQKQGTGEVVEPYLATLTGEYTCLPHRDQNEVHTMECAFGIKTETGEHYALDFGTTSAEQFQAGESATLTGLITPIEFVSSDHWQVYDIVGIFSVNQ